jgi:hypothetical protein
VPICRSLRPAADRDANPVGTAVVCTPSERSPRDAAVSDIPAVAEITGLPHRNRDRLNYRLSLDMSGQLLLLFQTA